MNFCYRTKTSQGVSLLLTKKKSKMLIKMTTEIALHFKTLYRQEIKHYIQLSIFSAHKVENIIKFSLRRFFSSVQFSSAAQLCLTLCDPMDYSMPGLPVHCQLQEFTQTRVHWVGDAIQPSHPLSSPSPPAFSLSWHHSIFKWVSSSHQVAIVLEFQLHH